ncbi:protein psiC, partial [Exaiptasia diaphana]|uniref:PA14 domain-containing protein n=1 Tax=Exaiptasia diaphana TaxID=2652724 RepID=A0A913YCY5_EXADI
FADPDFFSSTYANKFKDPTYIASPYGSWLSIPSSSSFSSWFHSDFARNKEFNDIIELKKTGESDSNGAAIYRYYESKFFPVDGKGFGAQGQRDCSTNALRNYGFTATVKGTFTFTGKEEFAFAGGEELWVFINRKRVVQLFHSPSVSATPCRLFSLKAAATKVRQDMNF